MQGQTAIPASVCQPQWSLQLTQTWCTTKSSLYSCPRRRSTGRFLRSPCPTNSLSVRAIVSGNASITQEPSLQCVRTLICLGMRLQQCRKRSTQLLVVWSRICQFHERHRRSVKRTHFPWSIHLREPKVRWRSCGRMATSVQHIQTHQTNTSGSKTTMRLCSAGFHQPRLEASAMIATNPAARVVTNQHRHNAISPCASFDATMAAQLSSRLSRMHRIFPPLVFPLEQNSSLNSSRLVFRMTHLAPCFQQINVLPTPFNCIRWDCCGHAVDRLLNSSW